VFAVNLNNPRTNANINIGFRPALSRMSEGKHPKGFCPVRGIKGARHLPVWVNILIKKKKCLVGLFSKGISS
jgi:hypothetical protein